MDYAEWTEMSKKYKVLVISPKCSEESAEYLAALLGGEYKPAGKTTDYTDFDVVVNYGSSKEAVFPYVINTPEAVSLCVNKISTLKRVKHGVEWTKNKEKALSWLLNGGAVVAREFECGSRSSGTTICETVETFEDTKAKFWTKYFPHTHEVRINVFRGEILSVYEKVAKDGFFTFNLLEIIGEVPQVTEMIRSITNNIGIAIYGLDVLVNSAGEYRLLEVNSGAALYEDTSDKLVSLLKREIKNHAFA